MRTLTLVCLALVVSPAAWACAVCYGEPDSPQTQALNMAIISMLGVVGTLLSLFAAFFLHLWVRSKRAMNEGGNLQTQPFARVNVNE